MEAQINDLAHQLGELAVEMQDEDDAQSTLEAIVAGAVRLVPGSRWAGISLVRVKHVEPRVPTDPIVEELDRLQSDLDDGPCLESLRQQRMIHIDDTSTEVRWPQFIAAARARGVASMLSFHLSVATTRFGSLNLYATETSVFDEESVEIGRILAQHASVALAASAAEDQFQHALGSRDLIGQAKGLLMERFHVSGLHAFGLLTRFSQDTNTKLVEIARRLVEDHERDAHDPSSDK